MRAANKTIDLYSPVRFLLIILTSAFLAETLVMFALPFLPHLSGLGRTLIDSILLVFLTFPAVYLFSFRPMVRSLARREQAESALRQSEQRYRLLFTSLNEGFALHEVICDPTGLPVDYRFLEVNPAFEQLTGLTASRVVGHTAKEVLPGLEPAWVETYGKVALTGIPARFSQSTQTLQRIYDVVAFSPEPGKFATLFMDVTERETALLALKNSEARLRGLVESSLIGVVFIDGSGQILDTNAAFLQMVGYNREELLVEKIRLDQMTPATYLPLDQTGMEEASSRGACSPYEKEFVRKDGSQIPVLVGAAREGGTLDHFVYFVIDHSRQKQIERELQESDRKLHEETARSEVQRRLNEHREQERQKIARDIHDGPVQELTGITFAIRNLLMDQCAPDVANALEAVQATLQEQIQELRTYASELRPPALAKFGLGKAIQSHLGTFREKYPGMKVVYEEDQSGDLLPDEIRLAFFRIYQESVNNIAKHARATLVNIRFEKTTEEALLEIQDNGIGFEPPEDLLELAKQGHLGLIGILERAEAIGGSVVIHSTPGQGTTIQVRGSSGRS